MWPQIVAFGLEPNMRCVDYGCGSLRLGQHAIRYLEPGNYFGVDVSTAFIEQGQQLVGDELLISKRPLLDLVSAEVVEQIARWEPSFIFSNAVLTHVPPDELGLFFSRLEAMMTGKSRAFVMFVAAPRVERLRSMTWAYSFEHVQLAAAIASPSLQLELMDTSSPGFARPGAAFARSCKSPNQRRSRLTMSAWELEAHARAEADVAAGERARNP